MKRIDRIYAFIKEESLKIKLEQLDSKSGFSATKIAEKLGMLRNNVSMELNTLLRMDKIIKIKGRPVLYFDKEYSASFSMTEGIGVIKERNRDFDIGIFSEWVLCL